jgi:hypothetical protein
MPIHFDYETDTLYLRGFAKGLEKGRKVAQELIWAEKTRYFVRNLLSQTEESDERIAEFADVRLAYVQKVRLELDAELKLAQKKELIHKTFIF